MAESSIDEMAQKIQESKIKIVSLNEQPYSGRKLHLEDGKCPVCDSSVEHLNPLFREEHIKENESK